MNRHPRKNFLLEERKGEGQMCGCGADAGEDHPLPEADHLQLCQKKAHCGMKRAWRRRRTLPAELAKTLPEARLFERLIATESALDGALARGAASAATMESVVWRPVAAEPQQLRIVITSTGSSAPPGAWWALRIQGELLSAAAADRARLALYISRIAIHNIPDPQQPTVEWCPSGDDSDCGGGDGGGTCFELRRAGGAEFTAKIVLELRHTPPVHRVAEPLAQLLNLGNGSVATFQRVALALWGYVLRYKLVSANGLVVAPDAPLRAALGPGYRGAFAWTELPQVLAPLLLPPVPIVVDFPVRLVADPALSALVFTVPVMCEAAAVARPTTAPLRPVPHDTAALDAELDALLARIEERCARLRVLRAIAADPVRALAALVASHALRDAPLAAAASIAGQDPDEDRRASTFATPQASAAAAAFLSKSCS